MLQVTQQLSGKLRYVDKNEQTSLQSKLNLQRITGMLEFAFFSSFSLKILPQKMRLFFPKMEVQRSLGKRPDQLTFLSHS